jgi:hypothetical protein
MKIKGKVLPVYVPLENYGGKIPESMNLSGLIHAKHR